MMTPTTRRVTPEEANTIKQKIIIFGPQYQGVPNRSMAIITWSMSTVCNKTKVFLCCPRKNFAIAELFHDSLIFIWKMLKLFYKSIAGHVESTIDKTDHNTFKYFKSQKKCRLKQKKLAICFFNTPVIVSALFQFDWSNHEHYQ